MARDVRLIRSPISVIGMALTTVSAVLFLVVFLADWFGLHTNPYIGIVFFLILPAIFLLGLGLIPLGAWIERRRRRAGRPASAVAWPRLDLNDPTQRMTAVLIFSLSLANVVIVSLAAYRGIDYMDSVPFCGQACHGPMRPEFVAYQDGPHSRVNCVQCHIGPGAASFARAKISGLHQVVALARNTYPRPIPSPVRDFSPARDTCEKCHSPEEFHGDKIRRILEYSDDDKSTESLTTVRVHVGGGGERLGVASGIHWHMNVGNEIEYITTDNERQVIPYVSLKDRDGNVREFFAEGVTPEQLARGERRRMDCLDCHNRPAHPIAVTAERAVDETIARGEVPRTLPFVRREMVKAVKASYSSQEVAAEGIAGALGGFYASKDGGRASAEAASDVAKAIGAARRIYQRNVFPEMRVTFGTYPSNIGHIDSPGCFRCHDDTHKTREGRAIGQECDTCHDIE